MKSLYEKTKSIGLLLTIINACDLIASSNPSLLVLVSPFAYYSSQYFLKENYGKCQ
jgi:hypothetical protein